MYRGVLRKYRRLYGCGTQTPYLRASQIKTELIIGERLLQDWQAAGLAKPSMLKPVIATVEKSQIVRVMGQLFAPDREGLDNGAADDSARLMRRPVLCGDG